MSAWESRRFSVGQFQLEQGAILPGVEVAFLTGGRLNADKSNAILVLHGYTSSHEFVCGKERGAAEGSWAQLVGPGKAIDTDRYFAIVPNALGSCFGTTGPASIDPGTGRPYGPTFPPISFHDIVETQYRLARHLGIDKLVAVVGVSMGGFAAWQWGIQHPGRMGGLVVVLSSLSGHHVAPDDGSGLLHAITRDPNWNEGWVYDDDSIRPALERLRKNTLLAYGIKPRLTESLGNATAAEQRINELSEQWASQFDPNSLVVLARAMRRFDVTAQLGKLAAKVFFMLATTDRLFPAAAACDTLDALRRNGVRHEYFELETEYGHQASGIEWHRWEKPLRDFLWTLAPEPSHA